MKKTILSSLILMVSVAMLVGQETSYTATDIPEDLQENANQVFRVDYLKLTVESVRDIKVHVKKVVTILNDSADEINQIIGYDKNSKITLLKANIFDALGNEIRDLKKGDFSDNSAVSGSTIYSDSRYKHIELNHSSYPYTIEIEYKISYKGLMHYPAFSFGNFATGVEKALFIVEMADDLKLNYKAVNMELEPRIQRQQGKTYYRWETENVKPIHWEAMMPNNSHIIPHIKLTPSLFYYDGYQGDFSDWASYGRFFYDINWSQTNLSPELAQKVTELTKGAKTDKEKVDLLYRYLQDNTRYVSVQLGIGGYQAFNAEYVEKNQYGDCKALSNYMLSMLKAVGVKAYHTLIYRSHDNRFEVDPSFTASFGNHRIIYLPEEDIWLECTSNDYPVNYLGSSNDDRPVMLLTEEGGKLARTPIFDVENNYARAKAEIKIREDGSAAIVNQIKAVGPKHEIFRALKNQLSEKEQDEWFLKSTVLPAFHIENLEFEAPREKPEAQMDYQIKVNRYASKAGKRIFVPINKLNVFDEVPPADENRMHPIEVLRSYSESDEYHFELPEGYEVESIPKQAIELKTDYGSYKVKITTEGSTLKYQRDLEIYKADLLPEAYEAFRDFRKAIAKADNMKVVLVKKKT